MTVVWYCDDCGKPVWVTPAVVREPDGTHTYDLASHVLAHEGAARGEPVTDFRIPDTREDLIRAINSLTRSYRFAESQHQYDFARVAYERRDALLELYPTVPA